MSHSGAEPRELGGTERLLKVLLHLRQDRLVPGLTGRLSIAHVALQRLSRAHQAERHADVAVWPTLALADTRWPHDLPRRGLVEPGDVDADVELPTLARAVSCTTQQAMITLQNPSFLNLLDCLADELLNAWCLTPAAFSWEACSEERLHMVPERLPRDPG